MNTPVADVIIPTRNRHELIGKAVWSVLASSETRLRLWVMDQSDDDATERALAPLAASDQRLVHQRIAPRGVSRARNRGAWLGSSPILLFTDDDCHVDPDWASIMISELQDAETWAAFGRVMPDWDDAPSDEGADHAAPVATKTDLARRVFQGHRVDLGFGHGASMGFRRDRFQEIGGFDPLLGSGGELRSFPERDIGFRTLARSGRVVYTPDAIVYHRQWRDWARTARVYRNYGFGAGAAAAKYVRCGDLAGVYLLAEWIFSQGMRQIASGVLKWRSSWKARIGLEQLLYPWLGAVASLRYPVNRATMCYEDKD
jgi:GT2 family glycosyltransferase